MLNSTPQDLIRNAVTNWTAAIELLGRPQPRVQREENGMKVIIVDDSAIIRERLVSLLAGLSEVEICGQADNISSALYLIRQLRPDVLILDIQMPGGSGLELLQQLLPEPASPIVMVLTDSPYPQYRKRCQEAGAHYFFDKATEFIQLAETLYELLARFPFARKETVQLNFT